MQRKTLSSNAKLVIGILVFLVVLNIPIIYYAIGVTWVTITDKLNVKKPNDDISQAIYDVLGDEFTYEAYDELAEDSEEMQKITGMKVDYAYQSVEMAGNIKRYEYIVNHSKNQEALEKMVNAVNEKVKTGTYGKVCICLYEIVPGGRERVAVFCNFSETGDMYHQLQRLVIYGTEFEYGDSLYNKCRTYLVLKDIRSLSILERMVKKAEKEEIDWNEVWPELEFYEELEE